MLATDYPSLTPTNQAKFATIFLPCPLGRGWSTRGRLGAGGAGAFGRFDADLRLGCRLLSVSFLCLLRLHHGALIVGRFSVGSCCESVNTDQTKSGHDCDVSLLVNTDQMKPGHDCDVSL